MGEDKKYRESLDVSIDTSDPIQSYIDAKNAQRNISSNWDIAADISGQVMSGAGSYQEAKRVDKENKENELKAYDDQFSKNVSKITENAGGLGEGAYGLATEQAKLMQAEYMEAVKSGDKEAQTKIEMKLQGLSTSVGTLKEGLTIASELQNDKVLSNGRTAEDKLISSVCTDEANLLYQDDEWKWKNPEYDGTPGSKEFFSQEDFTNSLGQIDEVTSKNYIEYENSQNESGMNYVNGTGADFDFGRNKVNIADQFLNEENLMSVMHDDFRKSGQSTTFASHLSGYLEKMPNYYEQFDIDVDGDGIPGNSEEDKAALIKAITDKTDPNYNFAASKDIVADYLTRQSEEKFYGSHPSGKSVKERKAMRPLAGETEKTFLARGGIMGELAKEGTVWNEDTNSWTNIDFDSEDVNDAYEKSLQ